MKIDDIPIETLNQWNHELFELSKQLLPCPFCGGKPILKTNTRFNVDKLANSLYEYCRETFSTIPNRIILTQKNQMGTIVFTQKQQRPFFVYPQYFSISVHCLKCGINNDFDINENKYHLTENNSTVFAYGDLKEKPTKLEIEQRKIAIEQAMRLWNRRA